MNRFHVVSSFFLTHSVALLLALWFLPCLSSWAQEQNVLFIIADDLGIDYMPVYQEGSDFPATPTIDALAEEGILFRNAWANPLCSPTRATMLTGQYGFRTGIGTVVDILGRGIDSTAYTLPRALDESGSQYASACVGKWHLSDVNNGGADNPNIMGFDHFSGLLAGVSRSYYNWPKTVNGTTTLVDSYMATENVDDAIAWLEEQDGPWFHWLSFFNAHVPFHKPPNELHNFDNLPDNPEAIQANPAPYFKAAVEAMDTEMGRLIDYLKETGQYENTTIVYLGDNGTPIPVVQPPFSGDRSKFTLYEGGVNVPFIISGAAVAHPNRESVALVNAVDLFATALELMEVDTTHAVPEGSATDSRSLLPIIEGRTDKVRDWVFTELFATRRNLDGKAMRDSVYKLIRFDNGREELYNLIEDPFEAINLLDNAMTDEAQTGYTTLSQQLDSLLKTGGLEEPELPQPTLSAGQAYPNPSTGIVTVPLNSTVPENYTYVVKDATGQVQQRGQGRGKQVTVDISALSPRIYYLEVHRAKSSSVTRIVRDSFD